MQRHHHLARLKSVALVARDCFGGSLERFQHLGPHVERSERTRTADQQKILGTVLFADLVLIGQVIADGGHFKIAALDRGFDCHDRWQRKRCFAVLRVPGRSRPKVSGIRGELIDGAGHGCIRYRHERCRAALGSARIAVDLDEAVGEIHRRDVAYPVGIELQPGVRLAGFVVADQLGDDMGLGRLRHCLRLLEVADRAAQEYGIQSRRHLPIRGAGTVDLLDEVSARIANHARIERVAVVKSAELRQCDARVERVGAGLDDIGARPSLLGGYHRLETGIEQRRAQRLQLLLERGRRDDRRQIRVGALERAGPLRTERRCFEFLECEGGHELLRGLQIVIAAIGPEELGVLRDRIAGVRIERTGMGHDLLQQPLLAQAVGGQLVVDDGIDRNGRLSQPVSQCLLFRRQLRKAIGLYRHEAGVAHACQQGGRLRRCGHCHAYQQ